MYVIFRKIDALAPDYSYCYQFQEKREAELKYQELLNQYSPRCLDLVELAEVQMLLTVDSDGNTSISKLELPIATQEQMGIIRLATALQANWDNPQDYADGMPVSVSPSLIKAMIEAGLAGAGMSDATTTQKGVVRLANETEGSYDTASNGSDNLAVMQPVATKSMIDTAAQYETVYSPAVSNIKEALDNIYAQINYHPLEITSFSTLNTTFEIGAVVSLTFTWTYNKEITSQTLAGVELPVSIRSYTIQDLDSTQNITLSAADTEGSVSSSVPITFTNRIYWGAAENPVAITSQWIKNLSNNKLSATYQGSYSFEATINKYAFIAIPEAYSPVGQCYINSWLTDLYDCGTISFYSDYGIFSTYHIFRTTHSGLGSFSMLFV